MSATVPKVFISYAREDGEIAKRIYRDLKVAGAEPWLDTECLLPGQNWSQEVGRAIRASDFFLALLSSISLGKRGHVQKEFREALSLLNEIPEGSIYLLPVRLDDCRPNMPRMEELHWVDLFPAYQPGLEKILRVVRPSGMASARVDIPAQADDDTDLSRTGWGFIVAANSDPRILEALRPLLSRRQEQASKHSDRLYREFSGETAYRFGDSYMQFLTQNGVGPGDPDPNRVPQYLLIVGGPEEIPFEFQYDLGIQYRVGRIHFDSVAEYANYAENVTSSETLQSDSMRHAAFFGSQHEGDRGSQSIQKYVTAPLLESMSVAFPNWHFQSIIGVQAKKRALQAVLEAEHRPDFIFAACHGLAVTADHPLQITDQGSLICADWPFATSVQREHYFSASDVQTAGDLRGMQLMLIGEYGGGTPISDEFESPFAEERRRVCAPRPFVSALAKRLLGRRYGTSAVLAHVDRTWETSFSWRGAGPQLQTFVNAVGVLLSGKPIGVAQKHFATRYAELAAHMTARFSVYSSSIKGQRGELNRLWLATIDARNYVIIGDPATRIQHQQD